MIHISPGSDQFAKKNKFSENQILICGLPIYTIDHLDVTVLNFMEKSIVYKGLKREAYDRYYQYRIMTLCQKKKKNKLLLIRNSPRE